MNAEKYVKMEVLIPRNDVNKMVEAINEKGYLKEGNYDFCYAVTDLLGHFRPLEGANPYLGEIGKVEEVLESKVEFRVSQNDVEEVYSLIRENHPYEVPVINILPLLDWQNR